MTGKWPHGRYPSPVFTSKDVADPNTGVFKDVGEGVVITKYDGEDTAVTPVTVVCGGSSVEDCCHSSRVVVNSLASNDVVSRSIQ